MARSELPSLEREQRFNDVLAEYLDALETGQPQDRAALLQRHPDLADDLEAFFARAEQVQGLAAPLRATAAAGNSFAADSNPPAEACFPSLPADQFRIVREVGRGGMGVVYEAMELSLGRRVALKVLRREDQADPRALERFRREARIVARLHHTNIVPIFQVGEHEGLHYFAMEFIDGRGLDRVLHELRQPPSTANALAGGTQPLTPPPSTAQPTSNASVGQHSIPVPESDRNGILSHDRYRFVARLGVDVTEALAHAHEHGVLHRDIKPSNLLLDRQGTVWVTDFGLAKEGQETFTAPGEVVGTLRYLAPERFSGQIDERGDVYSLGATLYELLTLRPVHDESDRAKLVARVLHEEPVRPRQLDPRIPRDLETIVLKALAKEPAGRYPTARALADDLRRFLVDAPIQARRASLFERGWRWCRRNPGIATTSAAAVVALVVGLAVALWQWHRADENAQRAETNAAQANKDFELAFQAIDQMLERVGGQHRYIEPPTEQTRRALLEDAVRFYQSLLRGKEDHPECRFALARACFRLGETLAALNDLDEARSYLNEALALAELLLAGDPNHIEYRHLVAGIYTERGSIKRVQRQTDAEADFREALARLESLSAECPDRPRILYTHALALLLASRMSRFAEAEPLLRRCVAVAEKLPPTHRRRSWILASALRDLAVSLESKGRLRESDGAFRRAQDLFDRAMRQSPEQFSRYELARSLKMRADFQARGGQPTEAEKLYRQSIEISERLVADFPEIPGHRFGLAETSNAFGLLLAARGQTREAETVLERSVSDWKDLVGKFSDPDYRVRLGAALHNLAMQRQVRGDVSGAKALYEEAIELQEKVATVSPEQVQTLEFLANHYRLLADVLVKLGRPQQAEEAISRQRDLGQKLADSDGKSAVVREFQARTCENLARLRLNTNRPGDAEEAYGEAARIWRKLVADFPDTPSHASQLGAALNDCAAVVLSSQGRWADMVPLLDEAIRVQEAAVQARPEVPSYQQFLYKHYSNRAEARLGLGNHADVFTTVTALRERFPGRFDDYLWAFRIARCISLAGKDANLTEHTRDKLQRQYADEAMSLLHAAQAKNSKSLSQIHTNPAFRPLHARADFQALLATVAKPAKTTK